MTITVLFIFNRLNVISELLALVVSVSIGAIVYGVLVLALKVDSTDYILDMVKSKLASRKK
jgi:putative peptidoglycan lipid II flippase